MALPRSIKIESAAQVAEHSLKLVFSDGKEQLVDFGPFLKASTHPEIRKFLTLKNFKKFNLTDGDIMWGDYDLVFPIADLYMNTLKAAPVAKRRFSSGISKAK